jgi:hypothetical protein
LRVEWNGRSGVLVDGLGLAGQRRLLDAEVRHLEQPEVGGDDGARLELHDVAGHQVDRRDLTWPAVADDADARDRQRPERRDGPLGAVLLHDAEEGEEDDDRTDRPGLEPLAERQGEQGRPDEDDHHDGGQLAAQERPRGAAAVVLQLVAADLVQAGRSSAVREALRAGREGGQDLLRLPPVPPGGGARGDGADRGVGGHRAPRGATAPDVRPSEQERSRASNMWGRPPGVERGPEVFPPTWGCLHRVPEAGTGMTASSRGTPLQVGGEATQPAGCAHAVPGAAGGWTLRGEGPPRTS